MIIRVVKIDFIDGLSISINGGIHADSGIDIQKFLITPVKRESFRDGVEKIVNTYNMLKNILMERGLGTAVGDDGGFAPELPTSERAIQTLYEAIKDAGYVPGEDIAIALDPAASEFNYAESGCYHFEGKGMDHEGMLQYYKWLIEKYPAIISIEDGFSENDWDGLKKMAQTLNSKIQIIGDDIFVTNPAIFMEGIEGGIANSILIKLNQIGTVSDSIDTIRMAKNTGIQQ